MNKDDIRFNDLFLRLPTEIFVKMAVNQNPDLFPHQVESYFKEHFDIKKDPRTKQSFINIEARLVSKLEGKLIAEKRKELNDET